MPCARQRQLLVLLFGMLATCVVIDENNIEELEIGSFINNKFPDPKTTTRVHSLVYRYDILVLCPILCFSYFIPRLRLVSTFSHYYECGLTVLQ